MTVIAQRKHKTIYRDGDKTVKVFDAEYSKADVLNEALNQARIEETGLNSTHLERLCCKIDITTYFHFASRLLGKR